jgi:signal peptidase I
MLTLPVWQNKSEKTSQVFMEDTNTPVVSQAVQIEKRQTNYPRLIIDLLETLVLAVLLFIIINVVTARIRVDGSSMEPTLLNGEFVLVNKLAYKFGTPKLGEVIVFHYPRDPKQEYIKRVIGVAGNTVVISDGHVYIDDELIQEPYIAASPTYGPQHWIVPPGSLFVLGDNRNNSSDSHTWGMVPEEYVVGKAVAVYWPPTKWSSIVHHNQASE